MITVGKKILYLRKQQHMTQKQLGLAVGFSESTAHENPGIRIPKTSLLQLQRMGDYQKPSIISLI